MAKNKLVKGEDFYYNVDGKMVLTKKYLLDRGFCCNCKCVNCPYVEMNKQIKKK